MLVLYAMALFWALYYGFIPWLYSGLYTGFHVAGPGRVRRFRRFRRRLGDRRRPPGSGAAAGKFSGARGASLVCDLWLYTKTFLL